MKDVLVYKDYIGSVHFNADDEVFFGKIEGIEDLPDFVHKVVCNHRKANKIKGYYWFCLRSAYYS